MVTYTLNIFYSSILWSIAQAPSGTNFSLKIAQYYLFYFIQYNIKFNFLQSPIPLKLKCLNSEAVYHIMLFIVYLL